jgi:hypothetical protein
MNILFTAQSEGLKIFHEVLERIRGPLGINKAGFYVAQSMYYHRFVKLHPEFESNHTVAKEWRIVEESKERKPNLDNIRSYEKAIGNPTLWEPLICDRRIYLGKQCKVKQDYRPRYSHEQMLCILEVALERLEQLLDNVAPDIVVSLDPVTFGDYLLYLFCRARGIPILFFRTTKIENYVEFNEGIYGCSDHVYTLFQEYEKEDTLEDEWIRRAQAYLAGVKKDDIRYEGMILIPSERKKGTSKRRLVDSLVRGLRTESEYFLKYRKDHGIPGLLKPFLYGKLVSPFKAGVHNWKYSKHYISQDQLDSIDFAFYPLQSEPEISSLIWGKSYMNHIETIRNVARSLPVGMKLLVKEHPRALGYRSYGYYRKILEIPNVLLACPDQEVQPIIQRSKLVISVATFVAFEAVIKHIPSVMLGGPRPFCVLPDSMIRYVHSVNDLAVEIADLMENYEYKERSLVRYIAATMRGSVPIDYFTVLLKKKERYGDQGIDRFDEEIEKLAQYAICRITDCLSGKRQSSCV